MHFNLTDEQTMLREGAERFLEESYAFEVRHRSLQSPAGCAGDTWSAFAEMGWLALAVPEECGGIGAGLTELVLIAEAMGRRAVIEPYASSAVLAARLVEHCGAAILRENLLGEIAAGTLRLAFAALEQDARYDISQPRVLARRVAGGYVIDGRKMLVQDAPAAHKLIVLVRREESNDVALLLVDVDAAGVTCSSYPTIDGRHAVHEAGPERSRSPWRRERT